MAVVEAAWNAFAQDGLDALAAYWAEDVDHRAIEGAPDDRGPMHGKDALRGSRRPKPGRRTPLGTASARR